MLDPRRSKTLTSLGNAEQLIGSPISPSNVRRPVRPARSRQHTSATLQVLNSERVSNEPRTRSRGTTPTDSLGGHGGSRLRMRTNNELSSICKVNVPHQNMLVCAGKTHLGLYEFTRHPSDKAGIRCTHDFMVSSQQPSRGSPNPTSLQFSKRQRQPKLSNIADVKAGFNQSNNYVAVCSNSTEISIVDLHRLGSLTDATTASLLGHTRSINAFEFNMVQSNLVISGGQDAQIRIWDLREVNSSMRCTIQINTGSEPIRDVKWMPYYQDTWNPQINESSIGGTQYNVSLPSSGAVGSMGVKFASIHDSGALLKFDIRQPTQFERKINAHTGPGLCLNWHPCQEYVATGGRDGKCSLWYVGDRPLKMEDMITPGSNNVISTPHLSSQSIHGNNFNSNNLVLPTKTIHIGLPVTKLKFRPSFDRNILNSVLAISSMGDDASVCIYSWARKYIPKHRLLTNSASLGVAWHTSDVIFNIDKESYINGWDLRNEATVLENLTKNVTLWRDIDGDGLLFVDQDEGSYEMPNVRSNSGNKSKWHTNFSSKPNVAKRDIYLNTDSSSNHGNNLNSNNGNVVTDMNSSSQNHERPSFLKPSFSFNGKRMTKPNNLMTALNGSGVSLGDINLEFENKLALEQVIIPPAIMTIDLPEILKAVREKHLTKTYGGRDDDRPNPGDNPIDIFKFLTKELIFSVSYEKDSNDFEPRSDSNQFKDDKILDNLMKNFDLTENATWANLINSKCNNSGDLRKNSNLANQSLHSKEITSNTSKIEKSGSLIINTGSGTPISSSLKNHSETIPLKDDTYGLNCSNISFCETSKGAIDLKHRLEILLELISICSHNSRVYLMIDDLPGCKAWVLIVDSLIWELNMWKEATNTSMMDSASQAAIHDKLRTNSAKRQGSHGSDYSKFGSSAPNSMSNVTEDHKSFVARGSNKDDPNFRLRRESFLSNSVDNDEYFDNANSSYNLNHNLKLASPREPSVDDDLNRMSDEENSEESDTLSHTILSQGIPITQKRQPRRSFIDSFISDDYLCNRLQWLGSATEGMSPHEKITASLSSAAIDEFSVSPQQRLKRHPMKSKGITTALFDHIQSTSATGNEGLFPAVSMEDVNKLMSDNEDEVEELPPWNPRKLLKQIYERAVRSGNVILAINLLTLFQDIFPLTMNAETVKSSVYHFVKILHQYESFEVATGILKHCENIFTNAGEQSFVQLYCQSCHTLLTNERSKTRSHQVHADGEIGNKFGYWYCNNCSRRNTLCVLCEKPAHSRTIALLHCGHYGHYGCFHEWFLSQEMECCPAGCPGELNLNQ